MSEKSGNVEEDLSREGDNSLRKRIKEIFLGRSNKEVSISLTEKIFYKLNLLVRYGIPAIVVIGFFAFNVIAWYPQFLSNARVVQADYSGEYSPYRGELNTVNGRALIVVHKGFATYDFFSQLRGIDEREDYSLYLDKLEKTIEEYLLAGDIVVYVVGIDRYDSRDYPYGENIVYFITNPSNGFKSQVVLDQDRWFSQGASIVEILRDAGVSTVTFAGEYANACVNQARTNFTPFEIVTNEALEYQP